MLNKVFTKEKYTKAIESFYADILIKNSIAEQTAITGRVALYKQFPKFAEKHKYMVGDVDILINKPEYLSIKSTIRTLIDASDIKMDPSYNTNNVAFYYKGVIINLIIIDNNDNSVILGSSFSRLDNEGTVAYPFANLESMLSKKLAYHQEKDYKLISELINHITME